MKSRLIARVLDGGLGLLFIYAGGVKALAAGQFVEDVHHFRLLPVWGVVTVAVYLPWLEMLAGLSLVTGWWRQPGRGVLLTLMTIFTFGLMMAWWRGIDLSCGCLGVGGASTAETGYGWLFGRNGAILLGLLLAGWLWRMGDRPVGVKKGLSSGDV